MYIIYKILQVGVCVNSQIYYGKCQFCKEKTVEALLTPSNKILWHLTKHLSFYTGVSDALLDPGRFPWKFHETTPPQRFSFMKMNDTQTTLIYNKHPTRLINDPFVFFIQCVRTLLCMCNLFHYYCINLHAAFWFS